MDLLAAIILGIVQGLTEFLPVSSSGHLELMKAIQGQNWSGEESLLMTVVLHFATALSTIVVFRKDIWEILVGLFQFKWNREFQYAMMIIISMIPAAVVGLKFDELLEELFSGRILLVGFMLVLTGLLLLLADRAKNTDKDVDFGRALIIGISQAIAILPGISRSGATIGTSVLLGIDKEKAARFSFLMVVPLILGKMAKDSMDYLDQPAAMNIDASVLGAGFLAAFVTGIIACTWMIKLVKRSQLKYFSYYCFGVGLIAIVWKFIS